MNEHDIQVGQKYINLLFPDNVYLGVGKNSRAKRKYLVIIKANNYCTIGRFVDNYAKNIPFWNCFRPMNF